MLAKNLSKVSVVLAALALFSSRAPAQTAMAYTLDDVMTFVKGGLSSSSILARVRNSCISFKVTQSVGDRLRSEGANDSLVEGLRNVCYKSDSKSGGDTGDRTRPRDEQRTVPPKKKTEIVTPKRVVPDPVVTRRTAVDLYTTTPNNAVIDWDFRTNHALSAGHFNNCQYDYTPAGYTITVLTAGSSCLDGSMQEWESNVRISAQATPVSGAPGYTYGIRFGISDDSTVGYYAFEVSSFGHFELSRYRNSKWEVVFPWQTGSGINANGTNVITADIRGSTVTFTINGISQYTYQASSPIRGRAGFGIIGFDKDAALPTVTFSSFSASGEKGTAPAPVTPTPATNNTTPTTIDYDFRTSQPLSAGRYGKCQYDYSSSGYTISVAEAGSTCIDGPLGDQPANVRIATTAVGLRGESGYTYGLRFGYTSDSTIGYYAFEVSEGGSFQLSRYRMKQWEKLIAWQRTSAVNAAATGIPNNLAVDVRGNSLTLFVNGTQVGTYQTPYPAVGPAGFGIIGYTQSGVMPAVTFSKFSVTPLSATPTTTTPTVTPSTGSTNWDFRTEQPLSTGLYGKCRYDYANGGYTISVEQPGPSCMDGPTGTQPPNIRVTATARGLRGGTGYTYGLRFGYESGDNSDYYAFELSEGGSFELSRYHNSAWEALIGWQRLSAIYPASSGTPNELAAEIRGSSVVLYVNGTQVGTYQLPVPPTGTTGFGVIGYDQSLANPAVVFTRFSITPLY